MSDFIYEIRISNGIYNGHTIKNVIYECVRYTYKLILKNNECFLELIASFLENRNNLSFANKAKKQISDPISIFSRPIGSIIYYQYNYNKIGYITTNKITFSRISLNDVVLLKQ